ncbi:MAG: alpha/beta family hydrolase [Rhodothermia bacterium]
METRQVMFAATRSVVEVSGILLRPDNAEWMYVLAHGAGAGMLHPFLRTISEGLAELGVATFRFQFPYMEQGRKPPNRPQILTKTIRSAVRTAAELAPGLRIIAGGRSMGGRMTSIACSENPIEDVEGLAFLGFPLHAPGRESAERGGHLRGVGIPMLFLQGTRDKLANLDLLQPLCDSLEARATLHILDGGDHSFKPLKKSGRNHEELMLEAQTTIVDLVREL